jgi:hypothetical protein
MAKATLTAMKTVIMHPQHHSRDAERMVMFVMPIGSFSG